MHTARDDTGTDTKNKYTEPKWEEQVHRTQWESVLSSVSVQCEHLHTTHFLSTHLLSVSVSGSVNTPSIDWGFNDIDLIVKMVSRRSQGYFYLYHFVLQNRISDLMGNRSICTEILFSNNIGRNIGS